MKTRLLPPLMLFICSLATAQSPFLSQLDSCRESLHRARTGLYLDEAYSLCDKLDKSSSRDSVRAFAKQLIRLSEAYMKEIKGLYGYRKSSSITPVYVGDVTTSIYPVVGGFIFPATTCTIGTLPPTWSLADQVWGHCRGIRMFKGLTEKKVKKIRGVLEVLDKKV